MFGIPARHLARYHEILSVFIRHGLGYMLLSGNLMSRQGNDLAFVGAQLREAFSELGPAYVKIGQLASTRSDLLPRPIIKELAKLQDRVPPLPFGQIRRVVEDALQLRLESIYQEFDPLPFAAASIAQVHHAVLNNGDRVAVKVQRPFLRETIKTDLEIFQTLVKQIEQRTQWGKRYPFRMLLNEFSDTIQKELDFTNEGRNAKKIASLHRRNSNIVIPKIYWELSGPSVLTMEYVPGIPLRQIIGAKQTSYDVHQIAVRLSDMILRQILLYGCFHADPHPGNVLVLPEERISLIDFGITGHLTPSARAQIFSLATALIRGKDTLVLKTLSKMGIFPQQINKQAFRNDISALRHKHFKTSGNVALGDSIQDFFDLVSRHGIYIPPEFFLVGKTLITLEGVLNELDPTISLIEQVKPFSRRFIGAWFNLKGLLSGFIRD